MIDGIVVLMSDYYDWRRLCYSVTICCNCQANQSTKQTIAVNLDLRNYYYYRLTKIMQSANVE